MADESVPHTRHIDYPKYSPWKRGRDEVLIPPRNGLWKFQTNKMSEVFDDMKYVNMDIDIHTKRAALRVSASVVSLVSSIGGERIFLASGTIIESCQHASGRYLNTILTSASLVTPSRDGIKVEVRLFDESVYQGFDIEYDLHYNISVVHICTHKQLQVVNLRSFDDSLSIDPMEICPDDKYRVSSNSDLINLSPGDKVIAVGRFHDFCLMVAPGVLSLDRCKLDCKELMLTNCQITLFFDKVWDKTGGGPLELLVIREGSPAFLKINMVVEEASPDKLHSWPLPKAGCLAINRFRRHR